MKLYRQIVTEAYKQIREDEANRFNFKLGDTVTMTEKQLDDYINMNGLPPFRSYNRALSYANKPAKIVDLREDLSDDEEKYYDIQFEDKITVSAVYQEWLAKVDSSAVTEGVLDDVASGMDQYKDTVNSADYDKNMNRERFDDNDTLHAIEDIVRSYQGSGEIEPKHVRAMAWEIMRKFKLRGIPTTEARENDMASGTHTDERSKVISRSVNNCKTMNELEFELDDFGIGDPNKLILEFIKTHNSEFTKEVSRWLEM